MVINNSIQTQSLIFNGPKIQRPEEQTGVLFQHAVVWEQKHIHNPFMLKQADEPTVSYASRWVQTCSFSLLRYSLYITPTKQSTPVTLTTVVCHCQKVWTLTEPVQLVVVVCLLYHHTTTLTLLPSSVCLLNEVCPLIDEPDAESRRGCCEINRPHRLSHYLTDSSAYTSLHFPDLGLREN